MISLTQKSLHIFVVSKKNWWSFLTVAKSAFVADGALADVLAAIRYLARGIILAKAGAQIRLVVASGSFEPREAYTVLLPVSAHFTVASRTTKIPIKAACILWNVEEWFKTISWLWLVGESVGNLEKKNIKYTGGLKMKYTTLSSFQKNMGKKPKTQIKFVFYVNSPCYSTTTQFFFSTIFSTTLFIQIKFIEKFIQASLVLVYIWF